jgi:Helix-turn-helix domain
MPPKGQPRAGPDLEAVAEQVFTALADLTRRVILAALASGGPATATDLSGRLPVTRQAIAKHLALPACTSSRRSSGTSAAAAATASAPDSGSGCAAPARASR